MSRSQLFAILSLSVLALVIGTGVGLWYSQQPRPQPAIGGIFLADPLAIEPFELVASDGSTFDRDRLLGRWSFLYFGYTFCPDICPTTLIELDRVQQQLAAEALDDGNAYWMVSVDPQRDTPEQLANYTRYFNEKFRGATGDRATIDDLCRQLGVVYQLHEPEPGKSFYLVDHSSTLLLIDPQGRLHAILTPPHDPRKVVDDYRQVRDYYERYSS